MNKTDTGYLKGEKRRWLRTLNVTDAPAHTEGPHCGSIGHVLSFSESCALAQKFGFDAVNADLEIFEVPTHVRRRGPRVPAFAFVDDSAETAASFSFA